MKTIILLTALAFISFKINDEDQGKKQNTNSDFTILSGDFKKMDVNSMSAWFGNNGSINVPGNFDMGGLEWPKGSGKTAKFASGIWLGCVSGNDTLTAIAEFSYDFKGGYVNDLGNPMTDSTYRIYQIKQDSINSYDYLHWPGNQGAYTTSAGKPFLIGDQTMFYVYTDGFPHQSGQTSDSSLKAQILQTNWAYNHTEYNLGYPADPFNNTIFMEYRIINRSNQTWNNMWVGFFTNEGLGGALDDKVGCDTILDLGYVYNATNNDGIYGTAPPAAGFKIMRGSLKYTGNMNDTVKYFKPFGSKNVITKAGYIDERMTVFNFFNNMPEPSWPSNNVQTFRVLKGLWRLGQHWVNTTNGDTTTQTFSGDPETNTGWIMPGESERRDVVGTGPFDNVNPGDTITIVIAQIIAKGNSNRNSVTQLKIAARTIQNYYDNNLAPQTIAPSPKITSYAPGNGKISLTWSDTNQINSFKNILSGGTYKFQGYNIYQIRTYASQPSASDTVLLKTFDIKDNITNISDSIYLPPNTGIFYGIVQKGSDNGISRYFEIAKDTFTNKSFTNGTEYKFAITSYYYDPTGGLYTYPKVNESPKSNIIRVVPQNITPGTQVSYGLGDTIYTDQIDLAVMPIIYDPLKLVNANYTSTFGGTNANPNWTVTKTYNGTTSILFENIYNFTGTQDSVRKADGLLFNHQLIQDSGLAHDPGDLSYMYYNWIDQDTRQRCWTYEPNGKEWFTAPDTSAIQVAASTTRKLIRMQFQSKSLGMSYPTSSTFRNSTTRIKAQGQSFFPNAPNSPILTGGPLRKIKFVFGQNQKAYRFVPTLGNVLLTDTSLNITPYADMTDLPFSVFAVDELDSSNGTPRQLNVAFIDADADGTWNPDTTALSRFHFTYVFASTYDSIPNSAYTSKNLGQGGGVTGFSTTDIMYAWLPRIKNVNGVPAQWTTGDVLTVSPYRITRPDFVPGYPVKYNWEVKGTEFGNKQLASSEISSINVFPNPYYGLSDLEYNDEGARFIYVSHLPQVCNIYFYTLDGILIKSINRNQSDPNNSLEKWDLKNGSGNNVASGMYLVYVDCKELGAKTLKIAVFTR